MGIAEKEAVIDLIFDGMLNTSYMKDSMLRVQLTRGMVRKLSLIEINQLYTVIAGGRNLK